MNYRSLLTASLIITGLWLLRCLVAGESLLVYAFIIWNVFLAAIPVLLEPLFGYVQLRLSGWLKRFAQLLLAGSWLLFLPNAFYVITDFMHLNPDVLVNRRRDGQLHLTDYGRGDAMYVLDSVLLFAATLFGAYVGGLALLHGYRFLRRRLSVSWSRAALAGIMLLVAVGVYIGRYGRWNSWDGLLRPWQVAFDLLQSLTHHVALQRFAIMVLAMMIFQLLCLWGIWRLTDGKADQR